MTRKHRKFATTLSNWTDLDALLAKLERPMKGEYERMEEWWHASFDFFAFLFCFLRPLPAFAFYCNTFSQRWPSTFSFFQSICILLSIHRMQHFRGVIVLWRGQAVNVFLVVFAQLESSNGGYNGWHCHHSYILSREGRMDGYDETTLHLANHNTFRDIRTCIGWLSYHIATDKKATYHWTRGGFLSCWREAPCLIYTWLSVKGHSTYRLVLHVYIDVHVLGRGKGDGYIWGVE